MLIEFALDALHVTPGHVGLVLAWGMLYALFNGMQAIWSHDPIYFFCDFTLAKTPFVGVCLSLLMATIFRMACALSRLKWRLLLGANHPKNPHRHDDPTCCPCGGTTSIQQPDDGKGGAAENGWSFYEAVARGPGAFASGTSRDPGGLDHPSVPYLQFAPS